MTAFKPKEHLLDGISRSVGLMVKDLKAIPEDKVNHCPGGCARTPLDMVVECGRMNRFVGTYLSVGAATRMPKEDQEAQLKSLDTSEKAITYLQTETNFLLEAIAKFDEERLGETNTELFGFPMTFFAISQLTGSHMMYHDGQLNYIQSLYGDDKVHWWE